MALVECSTCGQQIAKTAEKCPQCGATNHYATLENAKGCLVLIVVVLLGGLLLSWCGSCGDTEEEEAEKAAKSQQAEAECKKNLACWTDRHSVKASVACEIQIEKLAKYSYKWTNGRFEPRFSRYSWADKNAGTYISYGDLIQFQNGFGALERHSYGCIYDPAADKVLDVEVWSGPLP